MCKKKTCEEPPQGGCDGDTTCEWNDNEQKVDCISNVLTCEEDSCDEGQTCVEVNGAIDCQNDLCVEHEKTVEEGSCAAKDPNMICQA